MLTIRTLQNIKRGAWLTLINGIFATLFGVLYIILMSFMLRINFSGMEVVWQVFAKYNPAINSMIIRLILLKGIFIIALGIMIIYTSGYILKKKDKAAWIMLFIVGLIFWPSLLTFEILDKNIYTIIASFIGWITFIIGMLIPIRYYLQRDYSEY